MGCAKEAAGRAETSAIADAVESKGDADAVERGSKLVPRPEPGEADRPRFEELKRVVRDGIETFLDVSLALIEIRNRRLYRLAGFERFGDFCQAEFHLSRSYAYQLMDAAASVECQSTIPDVPPPTKAEQVRPLAGLSPEEKKELWAEAVRTAPNGGPPTGAFVKKIREAKVPKAKAKAAIATGSNTQPPDGKPDDPSGDGESATAATVPGRSKGNMSLAIQAEGVEKEFAQTVGLWRRGNFEPLRKRVAEKYPRWETGRKNLERVARLVADTERLLHELAVAAEGQQQTSQPTTTNLT